MTGRFALWCAVLLVALSTVAARAASLDPGFGTDGRVVLDFGSTTSASAGDLALQPDGKLVAAGWVNGAFGVVRLLPNGALDKTFGTGGVVLPNFGTATPERTSVALALQPDGAIVVAGPGYLGVPQNSDFAVMRLLPDGTLDTSFGQGGKVAFQVGPDRDIAEDVAVQPDGKIVVAGFSSSNGNSDFSVIRLTPHGRLDTGFASGGSALIPASPDSALDSASAIALLPDGRMLLAGVTLRSGTAFDTAVVRLTPTGQVDTTFGTGGWVVSPVDTDAWQEIVRRVVTFPDGSFLIGGSALAPGFGPSHIMMQRFGAAGGADATFATGGQLVRALGTVEDTSNGVVVDGSRIYAGVDSAVTDGRKVGVLALDSTGNPDEAFAPAGLLLFRITAAGNDRVAALVARPDGTLIEFATVRSPSSINDTFGFAAIAPASTLPVTPPPPDNATPGGQEQPQIEVAKSTISAPRAGTKLRRVRRLAGTATNADNVQIALVRWTTGVHPAALRGRCYYLRNANAAFRRGSTRDRSCTRLLWLRATGAANWAYRLKRALPRGKYVLYSRATGGGVTEKQGKRGARNRITFTVR